MDSFILPIIHVFLISDTQISLVIRQLEKISFGTLSPRNNYQEHQEIRQFHLIALILVSNIIPLILINVTHISTFKSIINPVFYNIKMLRKILSNSFYNFAKVCRTPLEAIEGLKDGDLITSGGFGLCGIPMNLINAVKQSGVKDLTVVSDGFGRGDLTGKNDWGLGVLLPTNQVKRAMLSFIGTNKRLEHMYLHGEIQVELVPQGTLAQKLRSGGAGISAFYTKTGAYTDVEHGKLVLKYKRGRPGVPQMFSQPKNVKQFKGKRFIEQQTLFANMALIRAKYADKSGNLYFSKTARNFNGPMATAADIVVVEAQHIVEDGQIPPEHIHVPGVYVDRIYQADPKSIYSKKIVQKFPIRQQPVSGKQLTDAQKSKFKIIKRAAKQVKNGMNINLGIGVPLLLPSNLPSDVKVNIQCQNGVFKIGPYAYEESQMDPDLINPGKQPITIVPGASFFDSATSFGIIRGHHLDLTMLGALQCSATCDIANWIIPGKMCRGMGGAMDLVASGSQVVITMQHFNKNKKTGEIQYKLLQECSLPITAKGVVSTVITELAVFKNINGQLILTQIAQETTLDEVQKYTKFPLKLAQTLGKF